MFLFLEIEEVTKQLETTNLTENKAQNNKKEPEESKKQQEATDPVKKLKNLKKRLREVESLEEKLKNGLIAKPEPEQLAKVERKNELLFQIHELEKQVQ